MTNYSDTSGLSLASMNLGLHWNNLYLTFVYKAMILWLVLTRTCWLASWCSARANIKVFFFVLFNEAQKKKTENMSLGGKKK